MRRRSKRMRRNNELQASHHETIIEVRLVHTEVKNGNSSIRLIYHLAAVVLGKLINLSIC